MDVDVAWGLGSLLLAVPLAILLWVRTDRAVRAVHSTSSDEAKLEAARSLRRDYMWAAGALCASFVFAALLGIGFAASQPGAQVPATAFLLPLMIALVGLGGIAAMRWLGFGMWVEFFTGINPDRSR